MVEENPFDVWVLYVVHSGKCAPSIHDATAPAYTETSLAGMLTW